MNSEKVKIKYHKSFEAFAKKSLYLGDMLDFVEGGQNFTPDKDKVFRFMENDLTNLKAVILGMDPYNSTYEKNGKVLKVATGRAFEVANVENWTDKYKQMSLINIFKAIAYIKTGKIFSMEELRHLDLGIDLNIKNFFDKLEKNGVMFLNASLTTIIGKSGAHTKIWEPFMNEVLKYIVETTHNAKWLIWGQDAKNRVDGIVPNECIYYSCHPATRVNNTFVENSNLDKIKELIFEKG